MCPYDVVLFQTHIPSDVSQLRLDILTQRNLGLRHVSVKDESANQETFHQGKILQIERIHDESIG